MASPHQELETLLERAGYELTAARLAGLQDTDALRAALRRAQAALADAEALASSEAARRRQED